MSHKTDAARLESIIMYIEDIDEIIQKHFGIEETLADKEGQYAVMSVLFKSARLLGESSHLVCVTNYRLNLQPVCETSLFMIMKVLILRSSGLLFLNPCRS